MEFPRKLTRYNANFSVRPPTLLSTRTGAVSGLLLCPSQQWPCTTDCALYFERENSGGDIEAHCSLSRDSFIGYIEEQEKNEDDISR